MTKLSYAWLKDYHELENKIIQLEFNLNRSKKELGRWTMGDLSGVKLTPDSDGAKLEEHIEALEYELAHQMNDLYDITKLISKFKGLEHQILYKKYIEGKTLDVVAEELDYTAQYIYSKHAQLRRMITFVEELA